MTFDSVAGTSPSFGVFRVVGFNRLGIVSGFLPVKRTLATGFADRESSEVRSDIDHRPGVQQNELARVVAILMEEFETVTARATQPSRHMEQKTRACVL
jgi:hypothetical protein